MAGRQRRDSGNGGNREIMDYLRREAIIGCMESRCKEYLEGRIFKDIIHLDSDENLDKLEIYQPVRSFTIQEIIDDHHDRDIRLRRPPPELLPLIILKISDDEDSYIIPSEDLSINAILRIPRVPMYLLEAVICKINQRQVIFIKNLPDDDWYYYQENHQCEPFNQDLNASLNEIIRSTSTTERKRLLKSAHVLVSMIFYNAEKYIYKKENR